MKIAIGSDFHLDFYREGPNGPRSINGLISKIESSEDAGLLIMAGDVVELANFDRATTQLFLKTVTEKYPNVVAIAGNHEFYNSPNHNIHKDYETLKVLYDRLGVHFLEKESLEINGVTIIGATLWTDFGAGTAAETLNRFHAVRSIADFQCIFDENGWLVDTDWMIEDFKEAIGAIEQKLNKCKTPSIVVTHHSPSFKSTAEEFRDYRFQYANTAFYSNLDKFILEHQPNVWAHGHMHNYSDYMIDKTNVICNPFGYPSERSASKTLKIIEC